MTSTTPPVRKEIDGLAFLLDLVRRYPDDRVMRAWAMALISGQRKAGFRILKMFTAETTLN